MILNDRPETVRWNLAFLPREEWTGRWDRPRGTRPFHACAGKSKNALKSLDTQGARASRRGNDIQGRFILADSFWTRFLGLMFRSSWKGNDDGILFPDCASVHTCFTYLRPDIVFIDREGYVLRVVAKASPWGLFLGPRGTRRVLEVPGGFARRTGMRPGASVQFQ